MALTKKLEKHLEEHGYKPLGDKPLRRTPVSVKLPDELDDYVRSQPNRNQWLIAAIKEKVRQELEQASA